MTLVGCEMFEGEEEVLGGIARDGAGAGIQGHRNVLNGVSNKRQPLTVVRVSGGSRAGTHGKSTKTVHSIKVYRLLEYNTGDRVTDMLHVAYCM